jgi:hypothetical protein
LCLSPYCTWQIEETFRDTKDIRFGVGLKSTHIGRADRRDRLLFLFAIAHALLTLLGAASEASDLHKMLKSSRRRDSLALLARQPFRDCGSLRSG